MKILHLSEETFDEIVGKMQSNFDLQHFKSLKTFKERVDYCKKTLEYLGKGSSRIVFGLDSKNVLKLAFNNKGQSQNEAETRFGDYFSILAKSYDWNENDYNWLISERAKKITQKRFKEVTGYDFNELSSALYDYSDNIKNKYIDEMWEDNDFGYDLLDFVGHNTSQKIPIGDLMRISSYGEVVRDGMPSIIIVDYGYNKDVHNLYYKQR